MAVIAVGLNVTVSENIAPIEEDIKVYIAAVGQQLERIRTELVSVVFLCQRQLAI